jgi:fumarate hydratase subunit alpha
MKIISVNEIKEVVSELCIEANTVLRKDVLSALKTAAKAEKNKKARRILQILIENAKIAKREALAICQDTGIVCVYLKIGQDVKISGGDLKKAVDDGVRIGYQKGYFRNSIVDPVVRTNTGNNTPAVIHTEIVKGSRVQIIVVPKGFGCENKSQIRMFRPTAGLDEIKKFIVGVVKEAGPDACPPYLVGIGIGGTFEKAAELSKEALLEKVTTSVRSEAEPPRRGPRHHVTGPVVRMEKELLTEINKLGIGAAGLGGKATALGVKVLTYPTHIAGLPVAVSIGCHAMRSASKII